MKKTQIPALISAALLCLVLLSACGQGDPGPSRSNPPPAAQSLPAQDPVPVPDPPPDPAPDHASGSMPDAEPVSGAVSEPEPAPEPPPTPEPIPEPPPAPEPEPTPDPPNTKLYVLMYHHFILEGEPYNDWMLTDVRLREDLQWMADHGWTTVLPSQLAAGEPLPKKAVMLTFDDGYDSNYTLAYPLLQEFQAKAVISIIVKNVDDPSPSYLTWEMCREMAQSGLVEFGSHTYACHGAGENGIKRLQEESREAYEARVLPDLQTSIDLIEANVGAAPVLFAYPNGIKDSWAAGFIQDHFAITLITRQGPSDITDGLYSLKRYNVSMKIPVSKILPG